MDILQETKAYLSILQGDFYSSTPSSVAYKRKKSYDYQKQFVKESFTPPPPQPSITNPPAKKIAPEKAVEKKQTPPPLPAAAPPKEVEQKPPVTPSFFFPSKDLPKPSLDLEKIEKNFTSLFPNRFYVKNLPSDERALRVQHRWKYKKQASDITILVHTEDKDHLLFLEQIAKALDIYFYPTRIITANLIEQEDSWSFFLSSERLKMILLCDQTLAMLPKLQMLYKEFPESKERYLADTPLFLLPDLSLYLQTPKLKASLWKALKQKLPFLVKK